MIKYLAKHEKDNTFFSLAFVAVAGIANVIERITLGIKSSLPNRTSDHQSFVLGFSVLYAAGDIAEALAYVEKPVKYHKSRTFELVENAVTILTE